MPKSIFSKNLLKARKQKRWSQEGAATAIREAGASNFTRRTLGYYEEGKYEPSHDILEKICFVYGIHDLKAFLTDPMYFEFKATPEELHRRYITLDETTRKAVELLLGIG